MFGYECCEELSMRVMHLNDSQLKGMHELLERQVNQAEGSLKKDGGTLVLSAVNTEYDRRKKVWDEMERIEMVKRKIEEKRIMTMQREEAELRTVRHALPSPTLSPPRNRLLECISE